MKKTKSIILLLCLIFGGFPAFAVLVPHPDMIEVQGLVSDGENGAAWLQVGPQEVLVTPGYILGRDVRVTAIRHEGVVIYREKARTYHVIPVPQVGTSRYNQKVVINCSPLPLWKVVRMIAMTFKKSYICNSECNAVISPQRHVPDMRRALEAVISPHHRYYGRDGIIYVCPVTAFNLSWTWYHDHVKQYDSRKLVRWFPVLEQKGSFNSDGRELYDMLKIIQDKLRIPIHWKNPIIPLRLYCSFKDRPWHEILENIVLYNGLFINPVQGTLVITNN